MGIQATLIGTSTQEDTVITTVQYVFTDEVVGNITIDVYHYRPLSVNDIITGISNRGVTEQQRLISIQSINDIIQEIPTQIVIE
jgi:hypothetical protein